MTGERLLRLYREGTLQQLARGCRTRAELAVKLGISDPSLEKAWGRLRVADRSLPKLSRLIEDETSTAPIIEKTDIAAPVDDDGLRAEICKGGDALIAFGSAMERASAEALIRCGSIVDAAASLHLEPRQLRAHLSELKRRAAVRGYSPTHDMHKTAPEGFGVKGVSTLYDGDGNIRAQWVKTKRDEEHRMEMLLSAMSTVADSWKGKADPIGAPSVKDDDLLAVYPLGDPHLGMYAWAQETGAPFDLDIAERNLFAATDRLVGLAPPARTAIILNLGDFIHADGTKNATTGGTPVDMDTRWPKVIATGVRTMRRLIDRALEKHAETHVKCVPGNHDKDTSFMLSLCLAQFYEREPRVKVDISPDPFWWFRFGKCLLGATHGHGAKMKDLPLIMATDRARDWGETEHRYVYTGHLHHDITHEYPGVIVETTRTLAAKDSWHHYMGYRSGRDMKMDVLHRRFGRINRHIVGIDQITEAA